MLYKNCVYKYLSEALRFNIDPFPLTDELLPPLLIGTSIGKNMSV